MKKNQVNQGEIFNSLARDQELLKQWSAGDSASGLLLMQNYYSYFVALCWRSGVLREDEQLELYQELVLRILKVLPKLKLESSFGGYLRRVFYTALKDFRDGENRIKKGGRLKYENSLSPLMDEEPSFQKQVEFSDTMELVEECSKLLSMKELKLVRRRLFDELSFGVIAKELDESLGNIHVIYHRARTKLRHCLEAKGLQFGFIAKGQS